MLNPKQSEGFCVPRPFQEYCIDYHVQSTAMVETFIVARSEYEVQIAVRALLENFFNVDSSATCKDKF